MFIDENQDIKYITLIKNCDITFNLSLLNVDKNQAPLSNARHHYKG